MAAWKKHLWNILPIIVASITFSSSLELLHNDNKVASSTNDPKILFDTLKPSEYKNDAQRVKREEASFESVEDSIIQEIAYKITSGNPGEAYKKYQLLKDKDPPSVLSKIVKHSYKDNKISKKTDVNILKFAKELGEDEGLIVLQQLYDEMEKAGYLQEKVSNNGASREKHHVLKLTVTYIQEGFPMEASMFYSKLHESDQFASLPHIVQETYTMRDQSIQFAYYLEDVVNFQFCIDLIDEMRKRGDMRDLLVLAIEKRALDAWAEMNDQMKRQRELAYNKFMDELRSPVEKILSEVASQINVGNVNVMAPLIGFTVRLTHFTTLVDKAYQPNDEVEQNLITYGSSMIYLEERSRFWIELYKKAMSCPGRNTLSTGLTLINQISVIQYAKNLQNAEQPSYSNQRGFWDKLPWDLRALVTEIPLCLVNQAFNSDLLVKDNLDRDVVVASREIKSNQNLNKWRFLSSDLAIDTNFQPPSFQIFSEDSQILGADESFVSDGKRRVFTSIADGATDEWELHDYDWENNLYLLYNRKYKEFLHADQEEILSPTVQRYVYTKIVDQASPAVNAVWRMENCN